MVPPHTTEDCRAYIQSGAHDGAPH
jgi:hypothetical protein